MTPHDVHVVAGERHGFWAKCSCGWLGRFRSAVLMAQLEAQGHQYDGTNRATTARGIPVLPEKADTQERQQ